MVRPPPHRASVNPAITRSVVAARATPTGKASATETTPPAGPTASTATLDSATTAWWSISTPRAPSASSVRESGTATLNATRREGSDTAASGVRTGERIGAARP